MTDRLHFSPFAGTLWPTLSPDLVQAVNKDPEALGLTIDPQVLEFMRPQYDENGEYPRRVDKVCGLISVVKGLVPNGEDIRIIRTETEEENTVLIFGCNDKHTMDQLRETKVRIVNATNKILDVLKMPHI